VLAPILSPAIRQEVLSTLETYLRDNLQSWQLRPDATWVRREPGDGVAPLEAQVALLDPPPAGG